MKIYYAMSISGEHSDNSEEINNEFIEHLKKYGEVLTEHFANPLYKTVGEKHISDKQIHDRDMNWLLSADVIVAEVSNISFGVGYEIGRAVENKKKILCLRKKCDSRLSAMISGCEGLTLKEYSTIEEGKKHISDFISFA
jgi:2'-deoxynucleoside 5'-phosphate N-hydrolase